MNCFLFALISILTTNLAFSYTERIPGTMKYPGCDWRYGGTDCSIEIEKEGPPHPLLTTSGTGGEIVPIDYSTEVYYTGNTYIALPTSSNYSWMPATTFITAIYYTKDGSSVTLPAP